MGSILKFSIINSKNISWDSDQLLVFLVENNRPSQYLKKWQSLTGNNINNIIENASFSFKFGQDLLVRSSKNSILLFGYGATRKTNLDYEKLGGILFSKIDKLGFKEITIISNLEVSENKQNVIISKLLLGFKLKSYSFLKYKENINEIRSHFKRLSGVKTYANAVEGIEDFSSVDILTDDIDIESKFTETHFDDKVANVTDSLKNLISRKKNSALPWLWTNMETSKASSHWKIYWKKLLANSPATLLPTLPTYHPKRTVPS